MLPYANVDECEYGQEFTYSFSHKNKIWSLPFPGPNLNMQMYLDSAALLFKYPFYFCRHASLLNVSSFDLILLQVSVAPVFSALWIPELCTPWRLFLDAFTEVKLAAQSGKAAYLSALSGILYVNRMRYPSLSNCLVFSRFNHIHPVFCFSGSSIYFVWLIPLLILGIPLTGLYLSAYSLYFEILACLNISSSQIFFLCLKELLS